MSTQEDLGYTKSDDDQNKAIRATIARQAIDSMLRELSQPEPEKVEEKAIPEQFKAYKDLYGA